MSDKRTAPITNSNASAWLPCVSLALTVAAYGLGAPARLARLNLRAAAIPEGLALDPSIRYEPALSSEKAGAMSAGGLRGLQDLLSRRLIALR